jgi:hypothetical protein
LRIKHLRSLRRFPFLAANSVLCPILRSLARFPNANFMARLVKTPSALVVGVS